MKKHFHFLLMAALVCSLCLSVTSCKSDDDSSNNGNGGEEQETYEGLSTLENDQLADLVAAWTDASRDDLNGTEWLNNTYEPTVGLELDELNPGIRLVVANTVEEADSIAASMLGSLGIDYENPVGFTYAGFHQRRQDSADTCTTGNPARQGAGRECQGQETLLQVRRHCEV